MKKDNSVMEVTNEAAAASAAGMTKKEKKKARKADKKAKKAEKKAKKKARWKKLSPGKKFLRVLSVILAVCIVVCGIAIGLTRKEECNYVFSAMSNAVAAINDGTWEDDINSGAGTGGTAAVETTIGEFVSGTYGGVQFDTVEDVVNYYAAAYDLTKSETANYIDGDGNTVSFYAMLGDEDLNIVEEILIDGKSNSIIDGLVPTILGTLFKANVYGLPPCANRDPNSDVDENGDSMQTCRLTADDIAAATVTENADGTITLVLQPVTTEMSHKGLDAQGKMFNTLGAIDSTVDSISQLSWSEGTTAENCKVTYENGTATVTIDPASGKITEADYNELITVSVTHANVLVIKNKSATLHLAYTQHFPASDQYILQRRSLTRV